MDKVLSKDSDVRTGTLERIKGGLLVGGPLLGGSKGGLLEGGLLVGGLKGVKEETESREGRKELTSTGTRRTRRNRSSCSDSRKRKGTEDKEAGILLYFFSSSCSTALLIIRCDMNEDAGTTTR